MAGGARPSSGYAFQRIWKWSQECAIELAKGRSPISHPQDPPIIRTMDALFLHVLNSRPELAPDLFFSLFSKVDSTRVARFMSDHASLADCLTIMASLPPVPFLIELAKTVGLPYGHEKRRGKKEKGGR
jgi:lycopene beta-cyclase